MKKKGMTLIEIIIAIAIIAIIAISIFPIFTMGLVTINSAGNRSEAQYKTQAEIENDLSKSPSEEDTLNIDIPGLDICVKGELKTKITNINGSQVSITYFKPNR